VPEDYGKGKGKGADKGKGKKGEKKGDKGKKSSKGGSESGSPKKGPKDDNDIGARTIYCGNLAWSVGWWDLKDFFAEIGAVEHAECLEYSDGRKTGSGIVRFKKSKDAATAIAEYNDWDLHGRPIFIREDKEGGRGPGSKGKGKGGKELLPSHMAEKQVYVGNLSYWTSWQTLKDHMAWLGDVEFCDVMVDRDGERAGWGLVRYKDKKNAKKAIDELSDSWLDGRYIYVREDKDGFSIKGGSSADKGKGKGDDKGKGKKGDKGKGKKGKGKKKRDDDDEEEEEEE